MEYDPELEELFEEHLHKILCEVCEEYAELNQRIFESEKAVKTLGDCPTSNFIKKVSLRHKARLNQIKEAALQQMREEHAARKNIQ